MKKTALTIPGAEISGKFNEKYNLLFKYGEKVKKLLTFSMTKDGSVVLITKVPHLNGSRYKTMIPARKGEHTIKWADMNFEEDEEGDVPGKVTFHATGVVNYANRRRGVRDSLKTMNVSQLLYSIIYPHISELVDVERPKRSSVCIEEDLPEDTHLVAKVLLSPPSNDIYGKYLEASTMGYLKTTYQGETIRHAEKKLILYVFIERGFRDKYKRNNIAFSLELSDQQIPLELKPKYKHNRKPTE